MLGTNFDDPGFFLIFLELGLKSLAAPGADQLPSRTRPVAQAWLAPHLDAYEHRTAETVINAPFLHQANSALAVGTLSFFAQSAAALIDSVGQALTEESLPQAAMRIMEDTTYGVCHLAMGVARLIVRPSEFPHDNMVAATKLGWSALLFWRAGEAVGSGLNNFKMPTVSPMPVLADGAMTVQTGLSIGKFPDLTAGPLLMAAGAGTPDPAQDLKGALEALDRDVVGPPTEHLYPYSTFGPWKPRLEALHATLLKYLGLKPDETIVAEMGPGPQDRMIRTLAPQTRKYIVVEPALEAAGLIERSVARPVLEKHAIVLGPGLWDISVKAITDGGVDIAYSSHPYPPNSPRWIGMGHSPRNPAHIMNRLGQGVREGGLLAIQTDALAYAEASAEMAALGWDPVFVQRIDTPFMPSLFFHNPGYLVVLKRLPQ